MDILLPYSKKRINLCGKKATFSSICFFPFPQKRVTIRIEIGGSYRPLDADRLQSAGPSSWQKASRPYDLLYIQRKQATTHSCAVALLCPCSDCFQALFSL